MRPRRNWRMATFMPMAMITEGKLDDGPHLPRLGITAWWACRIMRVIHYRLA